MTESHSRGPYLPALSHNTFHLLLAAVKSRVAKQYIHDNLLEEFGDEERHHPTKVAIVSLRWDELGRDYRSRPIPDIEVPGVDAAFAQLKTIPSLEQGITYANAETSACKAEALRTAEVIQVLSGLQLPKSSGCADPAHRALQNRYRRFRGATDDCARGQGGDEHSLEHCVC